MNAVHFYRLSRWLYERKIPLLPKIIYAMIYLLYNASIPYTAKIGNNTKFGYGGMGVVIHARATIGDNCIIGQQVTVGGKAGDNEPPVIGNNVYIATGAKIIGEITIGNDCVVGANCVVNKSVPDCSVVVGVPGKIIKSNIDITNYF
jgi:serine O-acetyltransferase